MLKIKATLNDRYRIESLLGEGGMGIVYLGRDLVLERFVAIKEIHSALPNYEKYIDRLRKEAKTLAMLQHPNIVTVHDLITHDNTWFLVMEYVEGVTLDSKIAQEGALPAETAIGLLEQMLLALEHAHRAGVIHRDFKPGNVMLTSSGQLKVMDFGLAKIELSGERSRSSKSEHTGGTLYYLSPEQVEEKPVDQRSDIYSFGMTCYELLAGSTPLKEKKSTVAILNAILRDNFPPPEKLNPAIPKALSEFIRKAIALKADKRFQSATEMLRALRELSTQEKKPVLRRTVAALWKIALVALVPLLILVTDWEVRFLETLGLRTPTTVTIKTVPAGARVILNGKESKTATPIRKMRAQADTNYVQIQMPDFAAIDTTIVLFQGQDSTLIFSLHPQARLALAVQPPEARVFFAGNTIATKDLAQLQLTPGPYRMVVSSEGHTTIDTTIVLAQGVNPVVLELKQSTVRPTQGRLTITSEPSGADVEIRGEKGLKRRTPLRNLKLASGLYEIRLRHDMYSDTAWVAAVDSGLASSFHIIMKQRPGVLRLSINPRSAVYLNEQLVAERIQEFESKLAPGDYMLKVGPLGAATYWKSAVTIRPDAEYVKTLDFHQEFKIGIAAVDSATNKALDAQIYVDGISKKTTPNVITVPFGFHEIEVRLVQYESQKRELNVESKDIQLKFLLKRLP